MTSGYSVGTTDLDSLLAPRGSLTAISNVGYTVGGTDISQRYAGASFGTAYGTTHYLTAGAVDIGTLFAAVGTLGYTITVGHDFSHTATTSVGYVNASANAGFVIGNCTPAPTFSTDTIYAACTTTGSSDFTLELNHIGTAPAANVFTTLTVKDHAGTTRTYTSASASTVAVGTTRVWNWGTGSSPVWTTPTDDGSTFQLTIV
jgi:hypothetical protein